MQSKDACYLFRQFVLHLNTFFWKRDFSLTRQLKKNSYLSKTSVNIEREILYRYFFGFHSLFYIIKKPLACACSVTQLFFSFRADVAPKVILLTPFENHIDYQFYFLRLVKASVPYLVRIL